jgi:hypothetical protein
LQDIEDKREEDREQFLQNKKVQENLTQEEKDDLKNKFRYLSRLAHPDTSEIENIDPKFLTFLTELKDAGALDVITQIYENIEVRGQSIEQAFSEYMNEKQENKTVSDTQLNIVRVQNEIIKYSKLKELLQKVRGSTEGIQNISKQLDDELDALRNEKVELEKVLEGLKIKDIEQPKDSSDSMVKVIHEVNFKKIEQPSGELSLENQIEIDRKDWEKAKRVMDKFLKDIEKNTFGWEIKRTLLGDVYIINSDIRLDVSTQSSKLAILEVIDGFKRHTINLSNEFNKCFINIGHNNDIEYNNSNYYRNLGSEYDQDYGYHHNCTFAEAWAESKNIIKKYLGIDLDELYGEGDKKFDQYKVEKPLQPSNISGMAKHQSFDSFDQKVENNIEKRDIWNPRNFEETMVAVKELESIVKTSPNFTSDGYRYTIHSPAGDARINFQNYNNPYTNSCGVFFKSSDFYIDLIKLEKQYSETLYKCFSSKSSNIYGLDSESIALPDINGPKTFQLLKNKLKEFGVYLDEM